MSSLPQNVAEEIENFVAQENSWLNQLKNCEDRIDEFKASLNRFSEIATSSDSKSISHFESLFSYYQSDIIRRLKHTVRLNQQNLASLVSKEPNRYYSNYLNDHKHHSLKLNNFFERFENIAEEFETYMRQSGLRTTA